MTRKNIFEFVLYFLLVINLSLSCRTQISLQMFVYLAVSIGYIFIYNEFEKKGYVLELDNSVL